MIQQRELVLRESFGMTEIFIARHGQNEDNAKSILNGHRDLPLTELGREQARELGRGILDVGLMFDYVYSSPLIRAFETARITAAEAILPEPQVMDLLIERDFGCMTGRPIADIYQLGPEQLIKTDTITYFISPEGAETFPQLVERGSELLKIVRREHEGERVLLVCHGDIGKMIYSAATGKPWMQVLKDFHFGNGDLIDIDGAVAHTIKLPQHNL